MNEADRHSLYTVFLPANWLQGGPYRSCRAKTIIINTKTRTSVAINFHIKKAPFASDSTLKWSCSAEASLTQFKPTRCLSHAALKSKSWWWTGFLHQPLPTHRANCLPANRWLLFLHEAIDWSGCCSPLIAQSTTMFLQKSDDKTSYRNMSGYKVKCPIFKFEVCNQCRGHLEVTLSFLF